MKRFTLILLVALGFALPALFNVSAAHAYQYIYSCGPTWSSLPVQYFINQDGTRHIPNLATIETVIGDSFASWGEPCCSNFSATYGGRTALTARNPQGRIVLSFEDSSWPSQYGGSNTIAVALLSVSQSCTIMQAPILFNSYNYAFRTNGTGTDLQSIATHEIGHLLGLDHSSSSRATMYASYMGGTAAATLHQDDIDGVCSLYTKACSCTSSSQCNEGDQCVNGQCEPIPCTSNSQCASGFECVAGDCVLPPCTNDGDCAQGFQCQNSVCTSPCATCRTCTGQSDCGASGVCYPMHNGNKCVVGCGQGGMCPGDSQCYSVSVQGDTYYVCLAPTATQNDWCPDSYTCTGDDGSGGEVPSGECRGLGNDCANNGAACMVDNDLCLREADGTVYCSCTCSSDSDCGSGNSCVTLSDQSKGCIVGGQSSDPCDGVSCASDEICVAGQCQTQSNNDTNNSTGNNETNNSTGNNETNNSTGNNETNNSTGNNDSNNSTGNNNQDDDPGVIVIHDKRRRGTDQTCATGSTGSTPTGWLLVALGCLVLVWTRRQRRQT